MTHPYMSPEEGRVIVRALGGQSAVMRAFGLSRPTVYRFCRNGAAGANLAMLRLAYWAHQLGVGVDWPAVVARPIETFPVKEAAE